MPRGLDHIVHAVRDLDAAGALYRRLGFTVGARNRHPWGTHNRIVQFPGVFIELLTTGEPELIPPPAPRSVSFGGVTREFLARGEGLAMLVLEGKGAAADTEAFRAAGIGDFDVFDFAREAKRPDGTAVKVAFSLAFAADAEAPNTTFFTCQQHYPENFWDPAFQKHANGVSGIAGVVVVAEEPEKHRSFFESLAGVQATAIQGGLALMTPRGAIEVVTPGAFLARFGVTPPGVSHGARLAALRFATADASVLQAVPELAGIAGLYAGNAAVVGREDAMGAVLVFEPAR
jgi:catechol 2,3-dioxygenase-like lactoylglutathione lyase family enzyme